VLQDGGSTTGSATVGLGVPAPSPGARRGDGPATSCRRPGLYKHTGTAACRGPDPSPPGGGRPHGLSVISRLERPRSTPLAGGRPCPLAPQVHAARRARSRRSTRRRSQRGKGGPSVRLASPGSAYSGSSRTKWYRREAERVNCHRHVEVRAQLRQEGEPEDDRRAGNADLWRGDAARQRPEETRRREAFGRDLHGMVHELRRAMSRRARLGAPHTVVFGGFLKPTLSPRGARHRL
jgi:hypothetical protein